MLINQRGDNILGVMILSFVVAHPGALSLHKDIVVKALEEIEGQLPDVEIQTAKQRGEARELEEVLLMVPESFTDIR